MEKQQVIGRLIACNILLILFLLALVFDVSIEAIVTMSHILKISETESDMAEHLYVRTYAKMFHHILWLWICLFLL